MARPKGQLYCELGIAMGLVGWGGGLLYAQNACRSGCAGADSLLGVVIASGFVVFAASFVGLLFMYGRGSRPSPPPP